VRELVIKDVEVYVYSRGDKLWVIDVRPYVEHDHVWWLRRKTDAIAEALGRGIGKVILIAVYVEMEAMDNARRLGVKLICDIVVE
jgi:hypothetical protein